jgi:hypothetical protein
MDGARAGLALREFERLLFGTEGGQVRATLVADVDL